MMILSILYFINIQDTEHPVDFVNMIMTNRSSTFFSLDSGEMHKGILSVFIRWAINYYLFHLTIVVDTG